MTLRTFTLTLAFAISSAFAQTPAVVDNGVLNGASFAHGQPVAPGTLVGIFGSNLAGGLAQADSVPLSTSLSGVSVTFNGVPAALYFVTEGQIGAQVPWNVMPDGVTAGNADIVVTRNGVKSASKSIAVGPFSPGIFSSPPGAGYAIAINLDGSLAAPAGALPAYATHPAKPGDVVIVLATGLGAVDHPIGNGADSLDALRKTLTMPTVLVGGQPAVVQFSGLSPQFPAVNQLNIVIPDVSGNALPLQLDVGGIRSTDQVVIAVQR